MRTTVTSLQLEFPPLASSWMEFPGNAFRRLHYTSLSRFSLNRKSYQFHRSFSFYGAPGIFIVICRIILKLFEGDVDLKKQSVDKKIVVST